MWERHERKHHAAAGETFWMKNSAKVRTYLGVPKVSSPWTSKDSVALKGVTAKCERQLDLINTAWESRLRDGRGLLGTAALARSFVVDVSQSVSRKPWTTDMKQFRPLGHVYSFEADRCLTGLDCFKLLGWPSAFLTCASSPDLLHVVEGALELPSVLLVQAAMWSNPWGTWHGVP